MLNKIIHFSLQNRLLILVASVLLLVGGLYQTFHTEVDVFPDLNAPTVVVMTEAGGMAAEEVEQLVTFPIETAVNGATGVRRVRSSSTTGFSVVWVEFDWDTDIYLARQIVSEKLATVADALPDNVGNPTLGPQSSILGELLIVGGAPIGDELLSVIADELNVKKVAYAADAEEYVSYEVKPQLKTLGPKYGRKLGAIKALMASDAARIVESTRNGGVYTAEIEGETVSLTEEDLLIFVKNKEGFVAQSDYGVTVILETEITPELEAEGYAREIISRVQNMRKDSGFEVTDHITLAVSGDAEIEAAVEKFGKTIASVTLADDIVPAPDDAAECDINGKKARIAVIKVC